MNFERLLALLVSPRAMLVLDGITCLAVAGLTFHPQFRFDPKTRLLITAVLVSCAGTSLAAAKADERLRGSGIHPILLGARVLAILLAILGVQDRQESRLLQVPILSALTAMQTLAWRSGFGQTQSPFQSGRRRPDSAFEKRLRRAGAQEERNRLARDLHDAIKQQLFAMNASVAAAQARLEGDRTGAGRALEEAREAGRHAAGEMEALLSQLRSSPLEQQGLLNAIRQQAEALSYRTGARLSLELQPLPANRRFVEGAQEALYRMTQEALSNVARHARAASLRVALKAEADRVAVIVEDDGRGFDADSPHEGMGLANLRERAEEFQGSAEVVSCPGAGTRVFLAVPYEPEPAVDERRNFLLGYGMEAVAAAGMLTSFFLEGGTQGFVMGASLGVFIGGLFVIGAAVQQRAVRLGELD